VYIHPNNKDNNSKNGHQSGRKSRTTLTTNSQGRSQGGGEDDMDLQQHVDRENLDVEMEHSKTDSRRVHD
jgi:hypothetical protein